MPELTLLIVLSFMAVLAALLALWFTVTLPTRAAAMRRRSEARPEPEPRPSDLSNDTVRGAKAPRKSLPIDVTAELNARRRDTEGARAGSTNKGSTNKEQDPPEAPARKRPDGDPFARFLDRDRKRDEF